MAKKKRLRKPVKIFAIVGIVLIIASIALRVASKKKVVNENPFDVLGTSAGNAVNGGNFCEYNGYIYFSNPMDGGKLYRMTADCKKAKLLCADTVQCINVYGDYIYYAKKTKNIVGGYSIGLCRCNLKGGDIEVLTDDLITDMMLVGNTLYYKGSEDRAVNKVFTYDLIKGQKSTLSDVPFSPANVDNVKIFYSNAANNHNIYCYDILSGNTTLFSEGNTFKTLTCGAYTYYIDLADKYSLIKMNSFTKETTKLFEGSSDRKCIGYNVYNESVFYIIQGKDNFELRKVNADGTNDQLVVTDIIQGVYCTSKYSFAPVYGTNKVYVFKTEGDDITTAVLKVH